MDRTREATLVVVDRTGEVRGVTGPLTVDQPWWQEVGPIVDVVPGATVLRMLEAEPAREEEMGGPVTYLIEHDGPIPLDPWDGELTDEPRRVPWARPGGPAADLAWLEQQVTITGPPRQHRAWHLSSLWSAPTADGIVWMKCVPSFFEHEGAVLATMADQPVPDVVARQDHRILMAELPGHDGYVATQDQQRAMVDSLVGLQLAGAERVDELLAGGVPDLRAGPLTDELGALVDRLAPDREPLQRLVAELPDRLDTAARTGLPDTLVHGDPHGGNCRLGVEPPIWFDWGDAFIGNPLLDVAALHRMEPPVVEHWLDRWAELVPGSDPHRGWQVLEPIGHLRMAGVYQHFLDNIEPNERVFHGTAVAASLDAAEKSLASSR